jgi:hypothetical protein
MNRFSLALAAAAISATAATGAMALQAAGDDQTTAADRAKLEACLRTERDPARCKVDADAKPVVVPAELLACLRDRGLQPPADPDELKMWIMRTPAAKPCIGVVNGKGPKDDCGADKPEVVERDRD